jgi:hypothetical protein
MKPPTNNVMPEVAPLIGMRTDMERETDSSFLVTFEKKDCSDPEMPVRCITPDNQYSKDNHREHGISFR